MNTGSSCLRVSTFYLINSVAATQSAILIFFSSYLYCSAILSYCPSFTDIVNIDVLIANQIANIFGSYVISEHVLYLPFWQDQVIS